MTFHCNSLPTQPSRIPWLTRQFDEVSYACNHMSACCDVLHAHIMPTRHSRNANASQHCDLMRLDQGKKQGRRLLQLPQTPYSQGKRASTAHAMQLTHQQKLCCRGKGLLTCGRTPGRPGRCPAALLTGPGATAPALGRLQGACGTCTSDPDSQDLAFTHASLQTGHHGCMGGAVKILRRSSDGRGAVSSQQELFLVWSSSHRHPGHGLPPVRERPQWFMPRRASSALSLPQLAGCKSALRPLATQRPNAARVARSLVQHVDSPTLPSCQPVD